MRRRIFLLFAVGLIVSSSVGRPQQAEGQATQPQQPSYQIGDLNTIASRVYTHVFKATSLGHEHGIEGQIQRGSIDFVTKTGTIVFDMRSFQADTTAARKYVGLQGETDASTRQKVQANMLGSGILDVRQFPTATFAINSIEPAAEQNRQGLMQYKLTGTFKLRGAERPIAVLASVDEKNGWTHLTGGFRIKQTDYGITPYTKAFGAIGIADELTIYGDFWVAGTPDQFAQRPSTTR